jgi:hypothetical protein
MSRKSVHRRSVRRKSVHSRSVHSRSVRKSVKKYSRRTNRKKVMTRKYKKRIYKRKNTKKLKGGRPRVQGTAAQIEAANVAEGAAADDGLVHHKDASRPGEVWWVSMKDAGNFGVPERFGPWDSKEVAQAARDAIVKEFEANANVEWVVPGRFRWSKVASKAPRAQQSAIASAKAMADAAARKKNRATADRTHIEWLVGLFGGKYSEDDLWKVTQNQMSKRLKKFGVSDDVQTILLKIFANYKEDPEVSHSMQKERAKEREKNRLAAGLAVDLAKATAAQTEAVAKATAAQEEAGANQRAVLENNLLVHLGGHDRMFWALDQHGLIWETLVKTIDDSDLIKYIDRSTKLFYEEVILPATCKKNRGTERAYWVNEDNVDSCMICRDKFESKTHSFRSGKHHCRYCGQIICGKCMRDPKGHELTLPLDRWFSDESLTGQWNLSLVGPGDKPRLNSLDESKTWKGPLRKGKKREVKDDKRVCRTCYVEAPAEIIGRLEGRLMNEVLSIEIALQKVRSEKEDKVYVNQWKSALEVAIHKLNKIVQLEKTEDGSWIPDEG